MNAKSYEILKPDETFADLSIKQLIKRVCDINVKKKYLENKVQKWIDKNLNKLTEDNIDFNFYYDPEGILVEIESDLT